MGLLVNLGIIGCSLPPSVLQLLSWLSIISTCIFSWDSWYNEKTLVVGLLTLGKVEYKYNLGSPKFSWEDDLDPVKASTFSPDRATFFHYCLFARRHDNTSATGLSRGIVASDFIVTLEYYVYCCFPSFFVSDYFAGRGKYSSRHVLA